MDALRLKPGFTAASVLGEAVMILSLLLRLLQEKDAKKRSRDKDGVDVESHVHPNLSAGSKVHVFPGVQKDEKAPRSE